MPRIVCISDTHNQHNRVRVPHGDILLHAGDFSHSGNRIDWNDVVAFLTWMENLPHKHKILVAGNHDWCFERKADYAQLLARASGIIYLQDSAIEIDGLKFYGTPWQPYFYDWAFNIPRTDPALKAKYEMIPSDTNVLITHTPPHGMLDKTVYGEIVGSEFLGDIIFGWANKLPSLKLHVFGHIHHAYGKLVHEETNITFVNASVCNEAYLPLNPPIFVDL